MVVSARGKALIVVLGMSLCLARSLRAQTKDGSDAARKELHAEILRQDSAMFEAFNAHDAARLMSWFSQDVEFFHDRAGLQHYRELSAGFRSLFERNDGMRRELQKDGLEIFPVPGYGAIEAGSHRFCHSEDGRDVCGTFKFVHVWRKTVEGWRVTRAVSYAH
jgi:ketosteroid isomerase-like protein